MSTKIHSSMLMAAMIMLAVPLLAHAVPVLVDDEEAIRSAEIHPMDDDVDCSKIDDEDARERCREAKRERDDDKIDDVDCRKIENDAARRRCREAKIKN